LHCTTSTKAARRGPGAREAANGGLDVPAVLRRRDEIVGDPDDSAQMPWVESHGVTLIRGRGGLAGEGRVTAGDEELEARRAVVLAGASLPLIAPIEGLDRIEGVWTNREATTATEIPRRLLIVGGGAVGVEMAQAFQTLGSQVTLVEGARRLLPLEEEFACAQVTTALEQYGVDVRTGQKAAKVSQSDGTVTVTTIDGATADGDVLLVALGRRPSTEDLGVEIVGLSPGDTIEVDGQMRVPATPWLYAVGDINGRTLHTHMGKYQARLAADSILGHDHAISHGADGALSPRVIFTDPQVASVGHTTDTAAAAGLEPDVYETETSDNLGGSFYAPGAPGTARFLVDRERRILVGCTITGAEVADFLHAARLRWSASCRSSASATPSRRFRPAAPRRSVDPTLRPGGRDATRSSTERRRTRLLCVPRPRRRAVRSGQPAPTRARTGGQACQFDGRGLPHAARHLRLDADRRGHVPAAAAALDGPSLRRVHVVAVEVWDNAVEMIGDEGAAGASRARRPAAESVRTAGRPAGQR
jgi:pyruvate/2-oxoglutarate dehydrogenase complex dihydrolipoamide dehydrogenase (E3) component